MKKKCDTKKRRHQRSIQLRATQWKWIDEEVKRLRKETGDHHSAGSVLRDFLSRAGVA